MTKFPCCDDLIFDIGMNHGADAAYYAKKGFRVLSIEANPNSVEIAKSRYDSLIGPGKITILNKALSNESSGHIDLFVCNEESGKTTVVPEMVKRLEHVGFTFTHVEVPCTNILTVISEWGIPYYMKIDIEGWDNKLLQNLSDSKIKPKYLSVELSIREYEDTISLLSGLGYSEFQLVSQKGVPSQSEPTSGFEGTRVEAKFSLGNSGLFGRDLPDKWMSLDSLKKKLSAIARQDLTLRGIMKVNRNLPFNIGIGAFSRKLVPKAYDWYDIHAR